MIKKIIDWFKESNRWKHILGGAAIGAFSNTIYCAAYTGLWVASVLEIKDITWGDKWDWIDWLLTIGGVAIGYLIRIGIIALF